MRKELQRSIEYLMVAAYFSMMMLQASDLTAQNDWLIWNIMR